MGKLIVDIRSEIADLIEPITDGQFWDFSAHAATDIVPGATYIIGREQMRLCNVIIRALVESNFINVIFSNPSEGSETLEDHCARYRIADLVKSGKILVISGGALPASYKYLQYESFMDRVAGYQENIDAQLSTDLIYQKQNKPYKFLFLNGRARPHRRYLIEYFRQSGLLSECLWTCLDDGSGFQRHTDLCIENKSVLEYPLQVTHLPVQYEVNKYQQNVGVIAPDVKHTLFDNEWGEVYIKPEPYIDTYFSLVTETIFTSKEQFRTEKIWKPIMVGHPFIAVSAAGFYRDLHNMGFKTFNGLISEAFDSIDDNAARIAAIANEVTWLCKQDLSTFLLECRDISKHNQYRLDELVKAQRESFLLNFTQFLKNNNLYE